MNATEYTANALRCLDRAIQCWAASNPKNARFELAQAAVWVSLAQGEQVQRIADTLERAMPGVQKPESPVCTCDAHLGDAPAMHANYCPCYVPD